MPLVLLPVPLGNSSLTLGVPQVLARLPCREAILGRPATDYSATKRMIEDFEPFCQFWTTAGDWKVRRVTLTAHLP